MHFLLLLFYCLSQHCFDALTSTLQIFLCNLDRIGLFCCCCFIPGYKEIKSMIDCKNAHWQKRINFFLTLHVKDCAPNTHPLINVKTTTHSRLVLIIAEYYICCSMTVVNANQIHL